jgi:hypothetical protein
VIASHAERRKPENEDYANNINNKPNENVESNPRKSRRKAGKLPEKYDPLYPDMEAVGREMAASDSEDEPDLSGEYSEPAGSDKRPGVKGDGQRLELPYARVKPVEEVPPQNLPPLKKGLKATKPVSLDSEGRIYRPGFSDKVTRVLDKVKTDVFDADITLKLRELIAVSESCGQTLSSELRQQRGESSGDAEALPKKVVRFDPNARIGPAESSSKLEKVFKLDTSSDVQTEVFKVDGTEIIRVVDPVLQFLQSNPETPVKVVVGAPVKSIKSVLPVINEVRKVESLLDPGSSIVSMRREIAESLGLSWNPKWKINLESANGTVNRSLGVAVNVPFRFNHITIHLQVHILDETAYDSLLGRPFDCLTESAVKNFANGSQVITLTSPHTGDQVVIPTYDRGKVPPKAEPFLHPPEPAPEPALPYSEGGDDVNFQ